MIFLALDPVAHAQYMPIVTIGNWQNKEEALNKNNHVFLEGRGDYFRTRLSFAYFRRCLLPMIADDRSY